MTTMMQVRLPQVGAGDVADTYTIPRKAVGREALAPALESAGGGKRQGWGPVHGIVCALPAEFARHSETPQEAEEAAKTLTWRGDSAWTAGGGRASNSGASGTRCTITPRHGCDGRAVVDDDRDRSQCMTYAGGYQSPDEFVARRRRPESLVAAPGCYRNEDRASALTLHWVGKSIGGVGQGLICGIDGGSNVAKGLHGVWRRLGGAQLAPCGVPILTRASAAGILIDNREEKSARLAAAAV